jgi:hypothetical protein
VRDPAAPGDLELVNGSLQAVAMPYVRTVETASGATVVQIVHSSHPGSRDIEHIGSTHDDAELEWLMAVARQRLVAGQAEPALGLNDSLGAGGPLEIISSRMGHLWDALSRAYDDLAFDDAAEGDEVFRQLVLARIIEPTSTQDSLRVLGEAGIEAASYDTVQHRLPVYARQPWRQGLAAACAAHARLESASLVLYDLSTLYVETDTGDGSRDPGLSEERRPDPQITIGLLTDASGFPLMVQGLAGDNAETNTMLPVVEAFMTAHQLPDVTVVADASMISDADKQAIEQAGLSFIHGLRISDVPYVVNQWRNDNPGTDLPDGHIFTQPWPTGTTGPRRDQVIYYQYRALHGNDQQVAKAGRADRDLEAKARQLAGLKGYVTNLDRATPEFVIGAYRRLFQIEKSFRMSEHDLSARPIYHHRRQSIDAHLTIVFAALAVSCWIEDRTGWSIGNFVRTARRYRTVDIRVNDHTIIAADPLPDDLRDALNRIHSPKGAH